MQLYGTLVLFLTFSVACGLRCYSCTATEPESCTDTKACTVIFNRCYSFKVEGVNMVTKGCMASATCTDPMKCCEGDLCNGAIPTGPGLILLLLSSALMMFFV
ncbi:PREDICTED: lymphocyte antigen 6G-like [Cyprinodon variegatus]|uniref:lymphocyte antigen 6G-like n=1 Tax=Cyprinodon variegatus TaxID=28743 RepID=UPI0007424E63|nr:PREDICTED: lymphocyte antigen 6G-like [Cyprinodon variegatus]